MLAGHIQSAAPMRVEWTAQNIATVFAGSAPLHVFHFRGELRRRFPQAFVRVAALNATVVSLPTLPIELHLMTAPPNMESIVAPPRKKKKGRKSLKKRHKSSVEMTQTQTQTNSQLR
ncbi:hypothetical protein RI054_17g79830 [Pseudoscourfieldia marina]